VDRQRIASIGALLAIALISTVLLMSVRDKPEEIAAPAEIAIGYFLENATVSGTGEDGRVLYRISAESVIQSPADGSINLDRVQVNYDPAAEVPWNLRADTGRMRAGGKIMELSGNVVAASRDAGNPVATISTDHLEFDPGTDTATTDSAVVIDYAGSVIHAKGLRALLRQDRLELLADVRGRYIR